MLIELLKQWCVRGSQLAGLSEVMQRSHYKHEFHRRRRGKTVRWKAQEIPGTAFVEQLKLAPLWSMGVSECLVRW